MTPEQREKEFDEALATLDRSKLPVIKSPRELVGFRCFRQDNLLGRYPPIKDSDEPMQFFRMQD